MWQPDHSPGPDWLAELVVQGAEALAAVDAEGRIVYANAAAAGLLGISVDGLVGRPALDLVHPDDRARTAVGVAGVGEGARPHGGLVRLRCGDGRWASVEVRPGAVELPAPPLGPGPVVALVLRDATLQDAHWQFLTALTRGEPFDTCVRNLADGLSTDLDGPMAVTFDEGGLRRSAGPLPPALAGVTADGALDATVGAPWTSALRSGTPAWAPASAMPPEVRARAQALGLGACVVVPVPDPGSGRPALLVQWPPQEAMADILVEALRRRPRQAVMLALERRDALRRLEHVAHHDDLSGLLNRARFFLEVAALGDGGGPYGVCYVDLDRFKAVNDTLGHVVGDHTIIVCAQRLERLTRPGDVVARLGGDEFAVARPDASAAETEDLATRIVDALAHPCRIGEHLVDVGASVGCAHSSGGDAGDAVVAAADVALYEAKRAGRGRWRRAAEVAPLAEPERQPPLPWVSAS